MSNEDLTESEVIARGRTLILAPPTADSIMVVAAHPDDIECWCAGTLALAADAGAKVLLVLVTSGDKGSGDPLARPAQVAARRENEARDAAKVLGLTDVEFLRRPDGEVENDRSMRRELVKMIRRWRPSVLFTHDPEHPFPPYLSHRDHRMVGRATLDAAYPLARDRLSFSEDLEDGLMPHAVREIWLFATTAPNACVDITASFERKVLARLAHRSQTSEPQALEQSWRQRAATAGALAGSSLAEAFVVLHVGG